MATRWSRLMALALFGFSVASCSSAVVREESYTPTRETLHIKSGMPVTELWDRWDEKADSYLLVDDKNLISWNDLPDLLADSKAPEVISKIHGFQNWRTACGVSAGIAAASGALALIGYVHNSQGERTFSIPAINILWGIAAASLGTEIASAIIADQKLRDAVQLHNDSTRSQPPSVAVSWEGHF